MAFDFKKEFKSLYGVKRKPTLVDVPLATYLAVAGTGNPNEENGAYAEALSLLYGLSYTIKMSKMGEWQPEGYFDYTVPPLEGLWWAGEGAFNGAQIADKDALSWVSLIRQPDFVTPDVFEWASEVAAKKKPQLVDGLNAGKAHLVRFAEGLCAQITHVGPYDDEPATIAQLSDFISSEGLREDISEGGESPVGHSATDVFDGEEVLKAMNTSDGVPVVRLHHEIYLGDPRKTAPEKLKTIIRHPVAAC